MPDLEQITDEALLDRYVKEKDETAFDELFARYQGKVWSLVYTKTRNSALAEDVVSEVFYKLFLKADSYTGESSFSTWIYRIAINSMLDLLKVENRRYLYSGNGVLNWFVHFRRNIPSPERLSSGLREVLGEAFADYGDRYPLRAKLLIAVDLLGNSMSETAELLGIPVGTVKSQLHNARVGMREILIEKGYDPRSYWSTYHI